VLLEGLSMNTSNTAAGDNINSSLVVLIDQLKLDETLYGPGAYKMELRNLDAASLARLQQTAQEMRSTQQSPEAMQMMMLQRYGEILVELLKKSPQVEITQLDLKTPDGDFTGRFLMEFDGAKPVSTQNPLSLVNAVSAKVEFQVGEILLHRTVLEMMKKDIIAEKTHRKENTPSDKELEAIAQSKMTEQLNSLTVQNILVREDGSYKASGSYEAGQIVLNGRPLPLQDLLR
jgi:uncharacterized protein YdgA (DUF945 family)